MKHPFRWIALAVGVAVAAFAVVLAVNVSTDPRSDFNTSRLLGKPAPPFTLTDLAGKKVTSADLVGKTVIVNFWNSWCAPCREELPALQQWYSAHRNDPDVVLLGIPRDDTSGAIRKRGARRPHGLGGGQRPRRRGGDARLRAPAGSPRRSRSRPTVSSSRR